MRSLKKIASAFLLMVGDVAALLISFLVAYYLRTSLLLSLIPRFEEQEALSLSTQLRLGFAYGAVIIFLVFLYERLYIKRLDFWEETRTLWKSVTLAFIFIIVLVFVSRQQMYYSRATILMAWGVSLFVFPLVRLFLKKLLIQTGLWVKKVIILGTNSTSELVVKGIVKNAVMGYRISGFLTEDDIAGMKEFSGYPVLGGIEDVKRIAGANDIRDFIIALPDFSPGQLVHVIEDCDTSAASLRIIPNIGSLFTLGVKVENVGDVLALNLNRNLTKPWNLLLKSVFEYVFILLSLIFLLPFFFIIGLWIKLDSRGPVFFIQDRIGKKGKLFPFIKFRSMYVDADKKLEAYRENHPDVREEWNKFQKIKGFDPRVTRVGRFLREYSLDELPQVLNVLKGNMSLVGPRPYLPREKDILKKSGAFISQIRPGLTGLWQVRGRNLLPFKQRILLDEYYIRNWSLWLDLVILFKTPKVLAKKEGAF
ncbi:MAG: undecaprenyl-phosphate galactose phosphotransferase WbaP [Acidobacteria bacterium]|nr:undecaprenyl-phosphate galactose phosphotransferase WbaP [Acidobacteriota bacterium]